MKKEKKRAPSYRAIAWRVTALGLVLWLACVGIMTSAVARDMYRQLDEQALKSVSHISSALTVNDSEQLSENLYQTMLGQLRYPHAHSMIDPLWPFVLSENAHSISSDHWLWGHWDLLYGFETAVLYYNENDETLLKSGNYLYFTYLTADMWNAGETENTDFTYIDLDSFAEGEQIADMWISDLPSGDFFVDYFLPLLRITGYFEGTQFHPIIMDRVANYDMPESLSEGTTYSDLDQKGQLIWENLFEYSNDTDQELVTIYTMDVNGYHYYFSKPFTVNQMEFDNLAELLDASKTSDQNFSKKNFTESIILYRMNSQTQEGTCITAVAVLCWPLQYAMLRLIPVYLVTFAITALMVYRILRRICKSLTTPLENLTRNIESHAPITPDAPWKEPYALEVHYQTTRQVLHQTNTELTQLRTALDYANHAEENRRQLISGITHELKTPLAVIHSYAEGLQAGIAGEKKEQYLSIILEETEKMDDMVLQMLDLSRLEAGKVRLASDCFSLLKLTRTVAEKLTPIAGERGLQFSYTVTQDFCITADERRMEQVITNLVSNAVKYANPDSEIRLKIYSYQSSARFYIENACAPLSEEALSKVWDTFYRTDPSRTETGTGLGLALVKRIIELHQGTCSVLNTTYTTEDNVQTCVEFGFTIPIG